MVRKKDELGGFYHEPPYTPEEERDFYRRVAGGPKTVLHAPKPGTDPLPSPQKTPPQPPAK